MSTRYEVDQLKRRMDRLDHELGEARRQLLLLETRVAAEATAEHEATPPPLPEEFLPAPPTAPEPQLQTVLEELLEDKKRAVVTADELPPPLPVLPKLPELPRPTYAEPWQSAPSPVRGWLQQLQLWPPSGEENAEVRLGAWWATRIGALLAVIGVVFFGVYISLNTPPWVKLAELAAIALGVCALGRWLERKFETFGGVIFGGGLALGYFTSYAAYALPAVKVLDNLWVAAGCQLVAVAVLVAASLWRRSSLIATMAVALGFVTAVFSRNGGLTEFAMLTAGLLGAVSVGLRRRKGWEGPSVFAMPASYVLFALVWQGSYQRDALPSAGVAWGCLATLLVLFFVRDWRRTRVTNEEVSAGERWFQGINTSLAVLTGVVVTLWLYRGDLTTFYFGTATLLAALAWVRSRQVENDAVAALLLAKTTGALTLGVIEIAGARTTAIALLVQAWVMAWTARRLHSRVLAVGTLLVAAVATGYHLTSGTTQTEIFSLGALQAVAFVLGLAALAHEGGRWLIANEDARRKLGWLGGAAAGLGGVFAASNWIPVGWAPATLIGLTVLFAVAARARRAAASGWAATVTLLAANAVLWLHAGTHAFDANLAVNASLVLAVSAAVAWNLGGRVGWQKWSVIAGAVTATGAVLTAFNLCMPAMAFGLASLTALLLTFFAKQAPGRAWRGLATLAVGLACWLWVMERLPVSPRPWLALAALSLWALPVVRRLRSDTASPAIARVQDALQVALATLVTLRLLIVQFHGPALVFALTATAAAVFALALRPGLRVAIPASWVFGVAALFAAATLNPYALNHYSWSLLAFAVGLGWFPAWLWTRFKPSTSPNDSRWLGKVAGGQTVLATMLGALVARCGFSGFPELLACVAITLTAVAVFRLGGVRAARRGALALAVLLGITTLNFINFSYDLGWPRELGGSALAALTLALLPLWVAGDH